MTAAEKLRALYEVGWRDERVATWIEDKYRKTAEESVSGPSSQSVYRWRKGTTIPSSLNQQLISELHNGELNNENHQDSQ